MRSARLAGLAVLAVTAVSVDARPAPGLAGRLCSISIVGRSSGNEIATLHGARRSLERCASAALAEDPRLSATASYTVLIGPNGEVTQAEIVPAKGLPASARQCLQRALARVLFSPPDGGGRRLEGDLLLGAQAPGDGKAPPLPRLREAFGVADLAPMALHARAPAPEGAAIDAAVRAARGCAAGGVGRNRLRVRALVTPSRELREVVVSAVEGAPLAACVQAALAPARATGDGATTAVAVDVELLVEGGSVRLAR